MPFIITYYLVCNEKEYGGTDKQIFLNKDKALHYKHTQSVYNNLEYEICTFTMLLQKKVYLFYNESYFGGYTKPFDKKLFLSPNDAQLYGICSDLDYHIQIFDINLSHLIPLYWILKYHSCRVPKYVAFIIAKYILS